MGSREERRRFHAAKNDSADSYNFLGHLFRRGEKVMITSTPHKRGHRRKHAANSLYATSAADLVIASLHAHEQGGPTFLTAKRRTEIEHVADFVVEYGRTAIDNGADIFVAHGPQIPFAVEIYKGKPMFHGLGTFVFQIETVKALPAEAYERYGLDERATPGDFIEKRYAGGTRGHLGDADQWRQIYALCEFQSRELIEARIYPVDLGQCRSRTQRGRPLSGRRSNGLASARTAPSPFRLLRYPIGNREWGWLYSAKSGVVMPTPA